MNYVYHAEDSDCLKSNQTPKTPIIIPHKARRRQTSIKVISLLNQNVLTGASNVALVADIILI